MSGSVPLLSEVHMKALKVSLVRSAIGTTDRQKQNLLGLGLRRPGQTRVLENTPAVRGMVKKVIHLVDVAEVSADGGDHGE
jgi:large subunit ribosomal protein L30